MKRIWHGWTKPEDAERYLSLLREEIIPGIASKNIPGYRGIEVLRREGREETEFITVMTFDSLENVKLFQGEAYRRAYVPEKAQEVLHRWDREAAHYEAVERRE